MAFFEHLNPGARLRLCMAVLAGFAALVAAGGILKMSEAGRGMHAVLAGPLASERLVSDWSSGIANNLGRATVLVEARDPVLVSRFAADIEAASRRNAELMKRIESLLDTKEERILFEKVKENRSAYLATREAVFRLKADGRTGEAYKALEVQYLPIAQRYQHLVDEFVQLERRQLNAEAQDIVHDEMSGWTSLVGACVIALALVAAGAWRVFRQTPTAASGKDQEAGGSTLQHTGAAQVSADRQRTTAAGKWDDFYDILA